MRSHKALRLIGLSALLLGSGCLTVSPPHPAATGRPEFHPEVFFAGHTQGRGTLAVRGREPRSLRVEGHGQSDADGSFRLEQTVTFSDGAVETRTWRMLRLDAHTYTATLSDAVGEVTAETNGNLFHLRYLVRRPAVYMEQWLYLQADGRTALNLATVTVLGIPWARLSEQITRSDEGPLLR